MFSFLAGFVIGVAFSPFWLKLWDKIKSKDSPKPLVVPTDPPIEVPEVPEVPEMTPLVATAVEKEPRISKKRK